MRKQFYYFILVLAVTFTACQDDSSISNNNMGGELNGMDADLLATLEDKGGLEHFYIPESHELNKIPQDPNNPLSNVKIELGKKLFYETGLAMNPKKEEGKGTYSCASCHVPGSCFQAGIRQGIGDGGIGFGYSGEGRVINTNYEISELDIQPLRTPSAIHGAYNRTTLWNGQFGAVGANEGTESQWTEDTPKAKNHLGYEGLEIQAIAGLGVHRLDIDMDLINSTYYKDLFDLAFGDFNEDERYTLETAGLAIAAYERTLLANQAPFQEWIRGDYAAMTTAQKEGALLFFGKAGCNNCHDGPALNSEGFFALGMNDLEGADIVGDFPDFDNVRKGRGGFTGNPNDDYKFKTPQLYGLKAMNFLGHGASFTSVREIIEYKNSAIPQNSIVPESQLAGAFQALNLTEQEITQLTDFVENALDDSNFDRYVPESVASGNCFPNNDSQSQTETGCN